MIIRERTLVVFSPRLINREDLALSRAPRSIIHNGINDAKMISYEGRPVKPMRSLRRQTARRNADPLFVVVAVRSAIRQGQAAPTPGNTTRALASFSLSRDRKRGIDERAVAFNLTRVPGAHEGGDDDARGDSFNVLLITIRARGSIESRSLGDVLFIA